MTERWKRIPGYRDFYEVSDQGRIRRLKVRGRWSPTYKVDRVLKQTESPYGYMVTRLISPQGKYRYTRVHRVVALAFIGPPPKGKNEINHLNGIKTDNRVGNLVWASRTDNALHSTRVLGKGRGDTHPNRKLNSDQVREIKRTYTKTIPLRVYAMRYGVDVCTILDIIKGRTWTHI